MKSLLTASIELSGTGGLFTVLARWSDEPAIHALAPIGYLLLSGGGLLLLVVGLAWLSTWWEPANHADSSD